VLQDIQNIEALEFSPGTDYLYSNNNPFLLIKIVEKISGKTFNEYAQEYLFKPHHLKNTVIKNQYPYTDTTLMAIPLNSEFEEDQYKISVPSILFSSTTEDLYHWMEALHSYAIISEQSLVVLSETATVGGSNLQAPLGDCITINNKISEHIHHGSSGNYEGVIQRFNEEDLSIILLTNQKHQNVFEIAEKMKDIIEASELQKE
jgi:CubicO group peptidase (beta-lactamase class C family)